MTYQDKLKRIVFTESEMHHLVDLVSKNLIVECKKTDSLTWKEKNAGWEKIAKEYNIAVSSQRTVEQLRCKFDNLKKDTRKYNSTLKKNLDRDGRVPKQDVKSSVVQLYEKISNILGRGSKVPKYSPAESEASVEDADYVLYPDDFKDAKMRIVLLKEHLFKRQHEREEELHTLQLELMETKIENEKLIGEERRLQIETLKKQLENNM